VIDLPDSLVPDNQSWPVVVHCLLQERRACWGGSAGAGQDIRLFCLRHLPTQWEWVHVAPVGNHRLHGQLHVPSVPDRSRHDTIASLLLSCGTAVLDYIRSPPSEQAGNAGAVSAACNNPTQQQGSYG